MSHQWQLLGRWIKKQIIASFSRLFHQQIASRNWADENKYSSHNKIIHVWMTKNGLNVQCIIATRFLNPLLLLQCEFQDIGKFQGNRVSVTNSHVNFNENGYIIDIWVIFLHYLNKKSTYIFLTSTFQSLSLRTSMINSLQAKTLRGSCR